MFTASGKSRRRAGFTLVELLVVCAIVGILATLFLAKIQRAVTRAREGSAFSSLATLRTAFQMAGAAEPEGYTDANGLAGFACPTGVTASAAWADHPKCARASSTDQWGWHPSSIMRPFLHDFPLATVGKLPYANGEKQYSGILGEKPGTAADIASMKSDIAEGNWPGWLYYPVDGTVLFNNGSRSCEGKRFIEY